MKERIAEALERIATCLEEMRDAQKKQIEEAQNAPQRIAEMAEQLKKSLGGLNNG